MKNYEVNNIKKNTLKINGLGDNKEWNKANLLTDFISPWDNKRVKKIEFRALWNHDNLYILFKVHDNQVYIDTNGNTKENIGNSDRVEFFFRANEDLNPYYCFEIDPKSRIMDFIAYPDKKFDFNWKWPEKDISVKSHIFSDYFVVEVSISIVSLKKMGLIKGSKIETGIYRAKYNKQDNLTYKPTWISWVNPNTEEPNFHIKSSFGVLELVE